MLSSTVCFSFKILHWISVRVITFIAGFAKKELPAEAQMCFAQNSNLKNQWMKCCLQKKKKKIKWQRLQFSIGLLFHSFHPANHGKATALTKLLLKTTTKNLPHLKPRYVISMDFFFQSITRHSFCSFLLSVNVHVLSSLPAYKPNILFSKTSNTVTKSHLIFKCMQRT